MQPKTLAGFALYLTLLLAVVPAAYGQRGMSPAPPRTLDTQRLRIIERNVLTTRLVPGPPQHGSLVEYFMASNSELVYRFRRAREVYERGEPRPFRMVTLVAGTAGIGKTFLKQEIFSRDYPAPDVCRFDIRQLYAQWKEQGKALDKPDLHAQDIVLNTLPALRDNSWPGLYEYLREQQAAFYVIDSLDEIHPDDYVAVLDQIERFAFESDQPFLHIVVLGRGLAFRDYWQKKAGYFPSWKLNLYMLEPVDFRTTGDLLVSSWNHHRFFHELSWSDEGAGEFTLQDYMDWAEQDFQRSGRFEQVRTTPPDAVDARVEKTLAELAQEHAYINSVLCNLAGNAILRGILRERVLAGLPYDEQAIKRAYFDAWLKRDTKSDNRPSEAKPEHLDLYMRLLEGVAVKYLRENRLDERGFFVVSEDEWLEVAYHGQKLVFPAHRVLDRSGLKYIDPRTPGPRRYRAEPIWFHRLLVDLHNERLRAGARELAIWLDAEGEIRVGDDPHTLAELPPLLVEARRQVTGELRLDVEVDHRCPFAEVLKVLEAGYRAGISDIHLKVNGRPLAEQLSTGARAGRDSD